MLWVHYMLSDMVFQQENECVMGRSGRAPCAQLMREHITRG